jgi:hypothetical protein
MRLERMARRARGLAGCRRGYGQGLAAIDRLYGVHLLPDAKQTWRDVALDRLRRLNPYLNPYGFCVLCLRCLMDALRERG